MTGGARHPAIGAAAVVAAGLALAGCAAAPGGSGDVVAERFARMPAQDDVVAAGDWYRPTVTVRGAARPWPGAGRGGPAAAPDGRFAAALALARRYETLALVVVQDGRIVLEDYAPGIAPEFRFDTQSMHRGLLALVVGAALADGAIDSLDARAARWLPEWQGAGDPRGEITIRHLLYGQSGLVDPPYANSADSPAMQMFIGTDLRALALGLQPQSRPGERQRGATAEAQVLGLVLERATRSRYADYLSRRLWRPIGAADAAVRLDRPGGNTRTFCCIQASARDWARVGQLVLERGRAGGRELLPPAWITQLATPSPLDPKVGAYWWVEPVPLVPSNVDRARMPPQPTPFASPGTTYTGGRGGQRVFVLPAQRAVVVRIGKIRYDFDDGLFANTFAAALQAR
ncbi:MAG: beta-lactamase family protein [Steroidobacteraceae bacterium]|jgi:CubicO group peptidase (beta-lactamase class C family)|nr:beta-lactamase family protein [Steroidobacteraceae bacterium]